MPDVGAAIRGYLAADAGVSALVGDRIYPEPLLQKHKTMPAITYRRVSGNHFETIHGSVAGAAQSRLTIDCFALSRSEADEVAEAVRKSGILRLRGVVNDVDILAVSINSGASHYEEPVDAGGHEYRYITSTDYQITFAEEV